MKNGAARPVIALAGRRIDAADTTAPRFPVERAPEVADRLARFFQQSSPAALVSSAACGADLLALTAALDRGIRCRVVLPFPPEKFRETSVVDRPGEWGERFDRVVQRLAGTGDWIVLEELEENGYAAVNERILTEAQKLAEASPASELLALVVWDGRSRGTSDLTLHFAERARRLGVDVEEILTFDALARAVEEHDYRRAAEIVDELVADRSRGIPYSAARAKSDLKVLRAKCLFPLMRKLAEAFSAAGLDDPQVQRQRAQALIDLGELDEAFEALGSLLSHPATGEEELAEARGLIGRVYKQRYVDAVRRGAGAGAQEDLRRAIDSYRSVYESAPKRHLWHGINAVSLLRRAARDGVRLLEAPDPRQWARDILKVIEARDEPDTWDRATAAEAALALDDYELALDWAERYVATENADAFELSSTYRQFVQVLCLEEDRKASHLLEILRDEMLRRRGGAYVDHALGDRPEGGGGTVGGETKLVPMLVRITDPEWSPTHVPDIIVSSRIGNVLACRGSRRSVMALLEDPHVVSIEGSRSGGTFEWEDSMTFTGVGRVHAEAGEKGDRALVAIIDSGLDVLHRAFLDESGNSRVVAIWDQTDSTGPSPEAGYGTEHTLERIAEYVREQRVPDGLGRDPLQHGTHVASIAAGRAAGEFAGGVAPEARLVVVIPKLEVDPGDPRSTGYSVSHADALQYIDRTAAKWNLPVVVNLSQGQNAGAHDGTSLLEAAFDQFVESGRKPGRVVVKSAGNERGRSGHAKVTVPPSSSESLTWLSEAQPRYEDVLELWFDPADDFRFVLTHPDGEKTREVTWQNNRLETRFASGNLCRMTYQRYHDDNGDSRLLISIQPGDSDWIATGTWELEIIAGDVPRGGAVHAWLERSDRRAVAFMSHQDEEITLSIPGTARTVICVGAVSASEPIRVGHFSSYGPTRDGRDKPDIAAPGLEIRAACSGTSEAIREDSGTSMAAPHVSGAVALLLSNRGKTDRPQWNAAQLQKALCRFTRNFSSRWDRGQGFGVLHLEKMLKEFVP